MILKKFQNTYQKVIHMLFLIIYLFQYYNHFNMIQVIQNLFESKFFMNQLKIILRFYYLDLLV